MKIQRFFLSICFVIVMSWVMVARAETAPDQLLQSLTDQMIQALKNNDQAIKKNVNAVIPLIEEILSPHVDYSGMARWIVGRQAWLGASETEKNDFTKEFKALLIRTYSKALTEYNNQTIKYLPIRGEYEEKNRVQVESEIQELGKPPTKVVYRLTKIDDAWKVYDIIIEGVSLLKGFQSQFSEEIKQKGFEVVILNLREHNSKDLQ
jgi:phospholipid transport system substrate-binding protein